MKSGWPVRVVLLPSSVITDHEINIITNNNIIHSRVTNAVISVHIVLFGSPSLVLLPAQLPLKLSLLLQNEECQHQSFLLEIIFQGFVAVDLLSYCTYAFLKSSPSPP